ncbi:aromatic ring-hydroxylating oxygenase subunit alpha [Euzebya rosea]|uniref:aromatic ring-hydroxylating oxygenase subunit alpha n=1 Tax=Euzebya rosea TaxID=2052804 RepID=UPI000D3E24C5|nr:aromatic ring-hydroxylating dioxygenase subunit alpha [Euzebya rosea]
MTALHDRITEERVHGSLYTDDEVYRLEMDRIFRAGWLFAGHSSEIPEVGDYVTRDIAGEPLILSRTADGTIAVLYNRCAHRGNRVCVQDRGNATSYRCHYHGWTYRNDGQLSGIPFAKGYDEPIEQLRGTMSMAAPRTDVRHGFVFVSFAPDGPDLDTHLGDGGRDMLARLSGMSPTGEISLAKGWLHHRLGANWKAVMENQVDGYHVQFTHASLFEGASGPRKGITYGQKSGAAVRDLGGGHSEILFESEHRRQDEEFLWIGSATRQKLPDYTAAMVQAYGEAEAHDRFVAGPPHGVIFPNLFLAEFNIFVAEPVGPNVTNSWTAAITIPGCEDISLRQLRRSEAAMGPAGMLIADDSEIAERNQAGFRAGQPEWVDLTRGRAGVVPDPDRAYATLDPDLTGELPQRAFWRQYKALMTS